MQTIPAIYLGISRSKTEVHFETPRPRGGRAVESGNN